MKNHGKCLRRFVVHVEEKVFQSEPSSVTALKSQNTRSHLIHPARRFDFSYQKLRKNELSSVLNGKVVISNIVYSLNKNLETVL